MDALKLPLLLTLCALIILMLRQHRPEFAVLASVAAGLMAFFLIKDPIAELVEWIRQIQTIAGMPVESINLLLRAGGIALISEFASDLCTDAGEKALAGRIDLAQRVVLTAMCVPLAAQMTERLGGLLG